MNSNDLKQLRTRIRIGLGDRQWIEYHVEHHRREFYKLNGPAMILPDGSKFWLLNSYYHRVDGPAVIWYNGGRRWYLDGQYVKTFKYQ